jgi:hypothetical protein
MRRHPLQWLQGVAVACCAGLAIAAGVVDSAMTGLLLASLAGGGVCAAWIFHTSEVGRRG